MKTVIVRGEVKYGGRRRGTVYVALFGRDPGPPLFEAKLDGPGLYEIHGVTAGSYFPQACISDKPCSGEAPPISFADGQFDAGRPLNICEGQVMDDVDIVLSDKERESMSVYQDGRRVELPG